MSGGFCHIVLRLVEIGYTPPFNAARTIPSSDHFPSGRQPIDKTEGASPQPPGAAPSELLKTAAQQGSGEEAGAYDAHARWVV